MQNFLNFFEGIGGAAAGLEILVLAVCLFLAFGVCRILSQGRTTDSVLFGRNTFDGLMFPVLSLILLYLASYVVARFQPIVVLKLALPIFVSLTAIRLLVRVLSASFPASSSVQFIERFVSWLVWICAILWITGFLPSLLVDLESISLVFGKTKVSLRTMIEGLVSSGLVMVLALWISATIESRILRDAVKDLSMRKVVANAIRAILLLIGLLFALSAVGVDLTALSVLGGAIGVGLGFGLQKLAANYVSGFVILLERSVRIGDTVKVDGFEGVVTDIKTRYTLIRAANGRESVVPNELIMTQRLENLSLADPKVLLTTQVTVGYESDVSKVQSILCAAAAASERVLTEPAPSAMLSHLGADGLDFTLAFWIEDPEDGQLLLISDVNIRLLRELRQAGIEIAYPQRVIHTRTDAGFSA